MPKKPHNASLSSAARRFLPYGCILVVSALLGLVEADFLYIAQEQDLFLPTPLFFRQCLVAAGGVLTWASAWLTQFFYYPLAGALLLGVLWTALAALTAHTFRLPRAWQMLSLIPVACLLVSVTDLGYWLFFLKLRGHFFAATVGTVLAVGQVWCYLRLPRRLRTFFIPVSTAVCYPLFGFYGLLGTLLSAVVAWRTDSRRVADSLAAGLSVAAVPIACYWLLYHETNISAVYWAALPVFCHQEASFPAYYAPYAVLVLTLAAMAALRGRRWPQGRWLWLQTALLAFAAGAVAWFWYKDDNFHRELSMYRSIDRQDWRQALATARKAKGEPTRALCMMRNVALSRLGRQGEEMFTYPNGAQRPAAPFTVKTVHTVGKLLYLEYGLPNYCFRWCMEDGVEYGWDVETLKLMAKCSLLNGESVAAQRFVNMLKKTMFHKAWARRYEAYIRQPKLMEDDRELQTVTRLMQTADFLTADQSQLERFLMEHFTYADSREPLLLEQTMIAAMQTKELPLFWRCFYQYTEQHRDQRVPRHYQEAAILYCHLSGIETTHMPFDPMVMKDYSDFAAAMLRGQQQGMAPDRMKPLLYERFRTTYFYDFYFNKYNFVEQ